MFYLVKFTGVSYFNCPGPEIGCFYSEIGQDEVTFLTAFSINRFLQKAGCFRSPCPKEGYFQSWALVILYWKQTFLTEKTSSAQLWIENNWIQLNVENWKLKPVPAWALKCPHIAVCRCWTAASSTRRWAGPLPRRWTARPGGSWPACWRTNPPPQPAASSPTPLTTLRVRPPDLSSCCWTSQASSGRRTTGGCCTERRRRRRRRWRWWWWWWWWWWWARNCIVVKLLRRCEKAGRNNSRTGNEYPEFP